MRLYLLPISTRRALIYCEPRSHQIPVAQKSYVDRAVEKANTTWADWEKNTKSTFNWKKRTTEYGNMMFRRIPFEEWGLKSIPSLRKKDKAIDSTQGGSENTSIATPGSESQDSGKASKKVEVSYPRQYQSLCDTPLLDTIKNLAEGRRDLHRRRRNWSIVGMPLTIPFGLLPIVPNLPFFYLVFRAWSHYRALAGIDHLDDLLQHSMLRPTPSPTLDSLYTLGLLHPNRSSARQNPLSDATSEQTGDMVRQIKDQRRSGAEREEVMLLHRWNGKLIAEKLKLPGLEVEIERAVEQVEASIEQRKKGKEKELQPAQNDIAKPTNAMQFMEDGQPKGQVSNKGPLYENAKVGK